jgi:hypothetical protein
MKLKASLAISAVALLAACGGGSSGTSNNPTISSSANINTLQTYSDGSGVISYEGTENGVAYATDVALAREVAAGTANLTVVPGTAAESGPFYVVIRSGTTSNGLPVVYSVAGEELNASGSEYVYVGLIEVGSEFGIDAGGTPVNGMPSGTFTYTGTSTILNEQAVSDGTFTMSANFNTGTASIAATAPAVAGSGTFFFGSDDIAINNSNGSFSTNSASIGEIGIMSQAASIDGYFAGTNATGVSGLVYPNSFTTATYGGVFYGSR